jgi:hypothetical protein
MTGEIYMIGTTGPQVDAGVSFGVRQARIHWSEPANALIITKGQGNYPLTITDTDGSNARPVIDQTLGDARYLQVGGANDMEGSLFLSANTGLIWRDTGTGGIGAVIYDNPVPDSPGLTLRRPPNTNYVYTEHSSSGLRKRLLTEDDLPGLVTGLAPTLLIDPPATTAAIPPNWTLFGAIYTYSIPRGGNSRLRVSVTIHTGAVTGSIGIASVRCSINGTIVSERRCWLYDAGAGGVSGFTTEFYVDCIGTDPTVAIDLQRMDGTTAGFTTLAAGGIARSQILIADLGPR